jgi:hypothetical protein
VGREIGGALMYMLLRQVVEQRLDMSARKASEA